MIDGVIFDADGTLLDSMSFWESTVYDMLSQFGVAADDALIKKLAPMSMYEGAVYLKEKYSLGISPEEFIEQENRLVEDFYSKRVMLKDGVRELIEMLADRKTPMTVASATDKYLIENALRHTGLLHYFTKVLSCSDIGEGKSSPAIYYSACSAMNTAPASTAIVEDSPDALCTAKRAGFVTVGIYDKSHNVTDHSKLCDVWFSDGFDSGIFARKLLDL